jgi:hypothetical protein
MLIGGMTLAFAWSDRGNPHDILFSGPKFESRIFWNWSRNDFHSIVMFGPKVIKNKSAMYPSCVLYVMYITLYHPAVNILAEI